MTGEGHVDRRRLERKAVGRYQLPVTGFSTTSNQQPATAQAQRAPVEGDLHYRVRFPNLPQFKHMIRSVCFLFVLQLMTSIVCAATFTVGPGGTYTTLQTAIDAAIDAGGDNEIKIQQGVYFQAAKVESDLSGTLIISGGWFSFFRQQTMDPSLTVFNGNGISRVLEINLSGGDLRFEYLSFVGGFAEKTGGGLEFEASNDAALSFVFCLFTNNRAGFKDGSSPFSSASAIHAVIEDQAGLSLERCAFRANETIAVVGGIGAVEATP